MAATDAMDKRLLAAMPESALPSSLTALQVSDSQTTSPDPVQPAVSRPYNTAPKPCNTEQPEPQNRPVEGGATMAFAGSLSHLRPLSLVGPAPARPKLPSRSESHASSSHGRSLSRTISKLSRSISRSSRSRSRPVSIALGDQPDATLTGHGSADPAQSTLIDIPTSSDAAHASQPPWTVATAVPPASRYNRCEVWAAKGTTLPVPPKAEDELPDRLGVLPSPGQSFFDRPNTARTSDSQNTPTQPKKFSLSLPPPPPQSIDDAASSSVPVDDDADLVSPTAMHREHTNQNMPASAHIPIPDNPGMEETALPHLETTAPEAAALVESGLDDRYERESEISADDHFEDARDTFTTDSQVADPHRSSASSLLHDGQNASVFDSPSMGPQRTEMVTATEYRSPDPEPTRAPPYEHIRAPILATQAIEQSESLRRSVSPLDSDSPESRAVAVKRLDPPVERPLSYLIAPRDARGIPMEQVNASSSPDEIRTQQAPAFVDSQPRATSPLQHDPRPNGPHQLAVRDRSTPPVSRYRPVDYSPARINSQSRLYMSDQYGLEGLAVSGPEALGTDEDQSQPDPIDANRRRRSSGIWQKIRRSGSRRRSTSRPASMVVLDAQSGISSPWQDPTESIPPVPQHPLTKPRPIQRAVTTSTPRPTSPQRQRRSILGSLFGRGNTDTTSQPQPVSKKLTKRAQTGDRMPSHATRTVVNDATFEGSLDYRSYEALRRHKAPDVPSMPPIRGPRKSEEQRRRQSLPPTGFVPLADRPLLPFERNGRFNAGSPTQVQMPEVFRPTIAGNDRIFNPNGPGLDRRVVSDTPPADRQPTLPTEHASWLQASAQQRYDMQQHVQRMIDDEVPRTRRAEGPSTEGAIRQRQAAGNEFVARSPAKEYLDQQTPWTIDLPGSGSSYYSARQPSHGAAYQAESAEVVPREWPLPPKQQQSHPRGDQEDIMAQRGVALSEMRGQRRRPSHEEERIPMSATSYPGQEWVPGGLRQESFE